MVYNELRQSLLPFISIVVGCVCVVVASVVVDADRVFTEKHRALREKEDERIIYIM